MKTRENLQLEIGEAKKRAELLVKVWKDNGEETDKTNLLDAVDNLNKLENNLEELRLSELKLSVCNCSFAMVFRGEDDRPFCASCKKALDTFEYI